MSYTITITKSERVKCTGGHEWTKVDTEEVARDELFRISADEPKTRIKDVYGYTPTYDATKIETGEVFRQTVDTLDFAKVIKAINGLE